ncbi:MAG: hypothetical protein O3C52_11010 [Proteobacteria bacterium]|nr:hypothetical protein [Pseudomonadota bacterium]MDA0914548.1 hypothetical protein [Pseudomonadota bacterium]MDA1033873.1 hypothetical protein [Pseudomonadota bacterium]
MMFDSRSTPIATIGTSQRTALRAFGWYELTARINAARDLRHELSGEATLMTSSFADAAAGYFAFGKQGKRDVNPNALGTEKACHGKDNDDGCDRRTSEAREIND